MELLRITGGARLSGTVAISGSKNAALPLMAAALLTDEPVELTNVPDIEDIEAMAAMLAHLGAEVDRVDTSTWRIHAARIRATELGAAMTGGLRGSLLFLGPLLARARHADIARPGGDRIGMRRVEQHVEGLRAMGADVHETPDAYVAAADRLQGARIDLDMPTVTGTENLMMAAALAQGITVINNAAREPHVVDLSRMLRGMGARISGAGTELVVVEGVGGLLHGATHRVTTDYIEAGTYMIAAAATGGDVVVERMRPADLDFLVRKLRAAGCEVVEGGRQVRVVGAPRLHPVDVTTWPHPGFASDLQSQFLALMTQAAGTSMVSEAIHEDRFTVVEQLRKLGADVDLRGRSAIVHGPSRLRGARVTVPDIRSGAALVIAALCADGVTELDSIFHLDRGYEDLEGKLRDLGAQVERVTEGPPGSPVRDLSGVVGD
ncbi:MAG TPA: UDP-N-acetylglucosamine 1-carboxyvinyltransferase [Candidatus Angelobacter sp.]|jgi:UDP-N-acetylglucosamine 1-carboxyvinyltransferase|nr:UDP-N-acetylglucosamine 1-carboxyvinyltransferase [Candidatus Angelobacter sp.]